METLAEDLLLLALDDENGAVSWQHANALPYGLGGALLMDLALQKRIDSLDTKIVCINSSPTGDESLDRALDTICGADKPRDARYWVSRLGRQYGLKEHLAHRLVARGILREEEQVFLWVIRSPRFPTDNPSPEASLRDRIRAVVLGDAAPDPRTLLLCSLINACNLTESVFSPAERALARSRITALVADEQFGQAVGKAVADVAAAVAAAATTAAAFTVTVAPGATQ